MIFTNYIIQPGIDSNTYVVWMHACMQAFNIAASAPTHGATSVQSINAYTATSTSAVDQAPDQPLTDARERVNHGASTSAASHPTPAVCTASGRPDRRVSRGQNDIALVIACYKCCHADKYLAYTLLRSPNVHFVSVDTAEMNACTPTLLKIIYQCRYMDRYLYYTLLKQPRCAYHMRCLFNSVRLHC